MSSRPCEGGHSELIEVPYNVFTLYAIFLRKSRYEKLFWAYPIEGEGEEATRFRRGSQNLRSMSRGSTPRKSNCKSR